VEQLKERALGASGALFVAMVILGNTLSTANISQSTHPTGERVLTDVAVQHGSAWARFGFVLEGASFVCLMVFVGFLAARIGARAASAIVVVAGSVMLAIKLGSGAAAMTLVAGQSSLSPELARVLNDLNSMSFVLGWLPFAVLTSAAAVGLQVVGALGRPTAYIGLALGALGVVASLAGVDDPLDANPMPFLLSMVWMLVVSVRLAVGAVDRSLVPASSTANESVNA
jgi:hypothetical protein